jgi:hypothetical protein
MIHGATAKHMKTVGSALRSIERAGLIRTRRHEIHDLPAPVRVPGSLGEQVMRGRDDERY